MKQNETTENQSSKQPLLQEMGHFNKQEKKKASECTCYKKPIINKMLFIYTYIGLNVKNDQATCLFRSSILHKNQNRQESCHSLVHSRPYLQLLNFRVHFLQPSSLKDGP